MHPELISRIEGMRNIAMAHHKAGCGMANAVIGNERENFIKYLLSKIFPNSYRFSSGEIIDISGKRSGQVDVVMEYPYEPSFPSPAGDERLLIAESVIIAFEVKSSDSQMSEVIDKSRLINNLYRNLNIHMWYGDDEGDQAFPKEHLDIKHKIPNIAVFYKGPVKSETFFNKYSEMNVDERPTAMIALDSGYFIFGSNDGNIITFQGIDGIYALICLICEISNRIAGAQTAVSIYLKM